MDLMTRATLEAALACEALAALRYSLYADRADDEGLDELARLFEAICCDGCQGSAREIAHALGIVGTTRDNLAAALEGEVTEHHRLYPQFAAQARRVGDLEAAELFVTLGRQERVHADRIRAAIARSAAPTLRPDRSIRPGLQRDRGPTSSPSDTEGDAWHDGQRRHRCLRQDPRGRLAPPGDATGGGPWREVPVNHGRRPLGATATALACLGGSPPYTGRPNTMRRSCHPRHGHARRFVGHTSRPSSYGLRRGWSPGLSDP